MVKNKSDQFIHSISEKSKQSLLEENAMFLNSEPVLRSEDMEAGSDNDFISMPKPQPEQTKVQAPQTMESDAMVFHEEVSPHNHTQENVTNSSQVQTSTAAKEETKQEVVQEETVPDELDQVNEVPQQKEEELKTEELPKQTEKQPLQTQQAESKKPYPVIGLALGGGGSLGLAHIGVLRVLDQNGIKVSKIAGTSMGSIVGAFYCNGYKFKSMHKIANKLRGYHLLDVNLSGKGLLNGKGVERIIKKYIPANKNIEDFKCEFACNAVDLYTGKEVVFSKGNVMKAIRSSFSVPGIFAPTKVDNMLLIDGGLVNNVPDNIVKNMGADIVIAVNVVNTVKQNPVFKTLRDVMYQSAIITQVNLRKAQTQQADVVIEPRVEDYKQYIFNKNLADEVIKLGEKATKEALPKILQSIIDFQNKQ